MTTQERLDFLKDIKKEAIKAFEWEVASSIRERERSLLKEIEALKVPFISEVEEFNATMGKPNNYEPIIPAEKEWMFVYDFILEELEEYKEACEKRSYVTWS